MKNILFTIIAALVVGFGAAQTAMVTGTFVPEETFAFGVELSTAQTGNFEGLAGVTLDFETAFAYAGLRYELAEVEGGHVYTALRVGAFNSLETLFSAPDAYGAYLGLGGLDEYSAVEAGVLAQTGDFQEYAFSLVVSVGVGSGR